MILLIPVLHNASGPDQIFETLALVLGLYLLFYLYLSGPDRSRAKAGPVDQDEEGYNLPSEFDNTNRD